MNKTVLPLKVVRGGKSIPAPRLCDLCASGAVLRGFPRGAAASDVRDTAEEQVICLLQERVLDLDVTECNRFIDRFPPVGDSATDAARAAYSAWVA